MAGGHDLTKEVAPTEHGMGTAHAVFLIQPTFIVAGVESAFFSDSGSGRVMLLADLRPLQRYVKHTRLLGLAMGFHSEPGRPRPGYHGKERALRASGENYARTLRAARSMLKEAADYFAECEAQIETRTGRNGDAMRNLGQVSKSCRYQFVLCVSVIDLLMKMLRTMHVPKTVIDKVDPHALLSLAVEHLFSQVRKRHIAPTAVQVMSMILFLP